MKILDNILDEKSDVSLAFFWQIIGPLFVLCTFALDPHNLVVFLVGAFGLFFCSRYQIKGFVASLVMIGCVAISDHIFLKEHHLWFFGLETSYAFAFFITAMTADRHNHFVQSLFSQIETKNSSIVNLEDEFTKSRADETKQQVFLQEKIAALQKQIEETLSEQSSLLILNEVLRKTASRNLLDSESLRDELFGLQCRFNVEHRANEQMERELFRLKNENFLIQENLAIKEELNAIRFDKEQTHLINETLAKLHAKEYLRAQSAQEEIRQLTSVRNELLYKLETEEQEKKHYQLLQKGFEAAELDRMSLKEQIKELELKLEQKQEAPSVDLSQYVAKEMNELLEERVRELSKTELLYRQLKVQFAEKNEVLHKTRAELFHKDNAYQALEIALNHSQIAGSELPPEIVSELDLLENEIVHLTQENEELEQIVTNLSNLSETESTKRKKKVKLIPEQDLLF